MEVLIKEKLTKSNEDFGNPEPQGIMAQINELNWSHQIQSSTNINFIRQVNDLDCMRIEIRRR